jgi:hypothetical protein
VRRIEQVALCALQLAACVDMSVELSDVALNFIRCAIESAAAKAQASWAAAAVCPCAD